MLLGNIRPGKAEGVETAKLGGGPDIICPGLFVGVIKTVGLSGGDTESILVEFIVSPLNLCFGPGIIFAERK